MIDVLLSKSSIVFTDTFADRAVFVFMLYFFYFLFFYFFHFMQKKLFDKMPDRMDESFSSAEKLMETGKFSAKEVARLTHISVDDVRGIEARYVKKHASASFAEKILRTGKLSVEEVAKVVDLPVEEVQELDPASKKRKKEIFYERI